jgi:hypothetical protein
MLRVTNWKHAISPEAVLRLSRFFGNAPEF